MMAMKKFEKKAILGVLLAGTLALQTGCLSVKTEEASNRKPQTKDVSGNIEENQGKQIMEEFKALIQEKEKVSPIAEFIKSNISFLSKEEASIMVRQFEEVQKENLTLLDEKYYGSVDIQKKIAKEYVQGVGIESFDKIDDPAAKELLKETLEGGYKVETAEGMFFPIINYSFYKSFSPFVTEDMKEYIEIMAIESDRVPAKDAALVISWNEVLTRALRQESFLNKYPASAKTGDVLELYKKYVTFALYGANNTPLFSYDQGIMVEEAKESFMDFVNADKESEFAKMIEAYAMELKDNSYVMNKKISDYREKVLQDLKSKYNRKSN